jgi:hypothetical protein
MVAMQNDGLKDMMKGERLRESDIPDDYMWLSETLRGKCRRADRRAKAVLSMPLTKDCPIVEVQEGLRMAEGVIAWALENGASKDGAGAVHEHIKKLLSRTKAPTTESPVNTGAETGVLHYLDACTGHITEQDMRLLDHEGRPRLEHGIVSVPHEYGAWVHCLDDGDFKGNDYQKVRAGGYSESFVALLKYAKRKGCIWINLDQAGLRHEDLGWNEW